MQIKNKYDFKSELMNYMRLWMGVLKETSVNFFVLWEFVYYAKYSSGYILGNSLTGDEKIFRAVQEVVTLLEWCSTDGSSGAATRHNEQCRHGPVISRQG